MITSQARTAANVSTLVLIVRADKLTADLMPVIRSIRAKNAIALLEITKVIDHSG
jgi:hypothetical protein